MKRQWTVILGLIVVILIAIFSVINVEPVEVNYLFGTNEWPLILVILFSVLLGGIMMVSVSMYMIYRLQHENKELKKRLEIATGEKELDEKEISKKGSLKEGDKEGKEANKK